MAFLRITLGVCAIALLGGAGGCYGGYAADLGLGDEHAGTSDGSSGIEEPLECEQDGDRVGASQLRRLSRRQYQNTIFDLLGLSTDRVEAFLPDDRVGPFATNSTTPITQLAIEKYQNAAEDLAAQAVAELDEIVGCAPEPDELACAEQFIDDFGRRAYRRPLTDIERSDLKMLFELGRSDGTFGDGVALVIEAVLQSPSFLYLFEGSEGNLDDYEVASRLSYLVWNTMPDDALFEAAAAGELSDVETLETHARRMMEDSRAAETLASFHTEWMELGGIATVTKDPDLHPEFDDAMRSAMLEEVETFVRFVFMQEDARLETLLTAPYGFPTGPLADVYGVEAGEVDGDGRVVFAETERSGLLTLPAVMAVHAHGDRTSVVHRGILVRERLLCQDLPPPPAEVNDVLPDPDPDRTEQDVLREHKDNPDCSGCHNLMDPIGFVFEHYDEVGRWRTRRGNVDVDVSGELLATDVDGEIEGVGELAARLLASERVEACVADQWFRYGLGRDPDPEEDACTRASLVAALDATDGDLREMLVQLIKSPSFRRRAP